MSGARGRTGLRSTLARMFLIRQTKADDVGTLLKLARMVYFINLPPDERLIAAKIQHSRDCFLRIASGAPLTLPEPGAHISGLSSRDADVFMFTIEDTESGGVVGTSQIKAHMGGPGNPNYSFKLIRREFKSHSLGFGTHHLVARLNADTSGPTEIGGLIIQPAFRGHKDHPGRLISFVRFHFMALYRSTFADRIIAEMMAQVTSDGDNVFWDHIGRKFIPVKYAEADRFCQHNRLFIDELLPKDDIYLTLLPLEVLNQVGQVGTETAPARRILERLGFAFKDFVDPFDGGPHLEAATDQVSLVKNTRRGTIGEPLSGKGTHHGIVSVLHSDGEFRAAETEFNIDKQGRISVSETAMQALNAEPGMSGGCTPIEPRRKIAGVRKPAAKRSAVPSPRRKVKAKTNQKA